MLHTFAVDVIMEEGKIRSLIPMYHTAVGLNLNKISLSTMIQSLVDEYKYNYKKNSGVLSQKANQAGAQSLLTGGKSFVI